MNLDQFDWRGLSFFNVALSGHYTPRIPGDRINPPEPEWLEDLKVVRAEWTDDDGVRSRAVNELQLVLDGSDDAYAEMVRLLFAELDEEWE